MGVGKPSRYDSISEPSKSDTQRLVVGQLIIIISFIRFENSNRCGQGLTQNQAINIEESINHMNYKLKIIGSLLSCAVLFAPAIAAAASPAQSASQPKPQQKGKWINLLANNSLSAWHKYLGGAETGWQVENGILSTLESKAILSPTKISATSN